MTQRTGGEAVVQSLLNQGVDTLFGLPGVQNDWLYNALYDWQDQIRVIHSRHEQGAGYMALGYALALGQIGIYNVVPGPGLLNSFAALATAYGLNAQVLCLTGQIPSHQIDKGIGVLHEIPDQLGMLRHLTKWADRINHPAEAPAQVAEAFWQLNSGRPRPVGLEVPMDVLAQQAVVNFDVPNRPPYRPPVNVDVLEQAAAWLGQAKNPLIFVGSGALNVSAEVTALAEALQAAVVGYRTGLGVIDGRHTLSLPLPPAHEMWKTTDVVLAIGTNLRLPHRWGKDENLKVIRIDVDPTAHSRLRKPDLALTARAEEALPLLLEEVSKHNHPRASRRDEMLSLKARWARQTAYLEPQLSYLKLIREMLGEDGVFVDELTQIGFAARITYPVYKPRTFISTGYQGTLGYGFPTALGVKVARPEVPVISVTGDGGFMFAVQELATAVQQQIGLVILLFNNNQYGNVQQIQKNSFDNRVIATDLHNPDFVKLAESFGAQGLRAHNPEQLQRAIEMGFQSSGPTLVEIPVGDVPSVDRFRSLGKVRPPQRSC